MHKPAKAPIPASRQKVEADIDTFVDRVLDTLDEARTKMSATERKAADRKTKAILGK